MAATGLVRVSPLAGLTACMLWSSFGTCRICTRLDAAPVSQNICVLSWLCLKLFLILFLAPDCHFPKEIAGFGPISARNLDFFHFYFGLSTARLLTWNSDGVFVRQTAEAEPSDGCLVVRGFFEAA